MNWFAWLILTQEGQRLMRAPPKSLSAQERTGLRWIKERIQITEFQQKIQAQYGKWPTVKALLDGFLANGWILIVDELPPEEEYRWEDLSSPAAIEEIQQHQQEIQTNLESTHSLEEILRQFKQNSPSVSVSHSSDIPGSKPTTPTLEPAPPGGDEPILAFSLEDIEVISVKPEEGGVDHPLAEDEGVPPPSLLVKDAILEHFDSKDQMGVSSSEGVSKEKTPEQKARWEKELAKMKKFQESQRVTQVKPSPSPSVVVKPAMPTSGVAPEMVFGTAASKLKKFTKKPPVKE